MMITMMMERALWSGQLYSDRFAGLFTRAQSMCTWQSADHLRRGGDEAESFPLVDLCTADAALAQLSGAGISIFFPLSIFCFVCFFASPLLDSQRLCISDDALFKVCHTFEDSSLPPLLRSTILAFDTNSVVLLTTRRRGKA